MLPAGMPRESSSRRSSAPSGLIAPKIAMRIPPFASAGMSFAFGCRAGRLLGRSVAARLRGLPRDESGEEIDERRREQNGLGMCRDERHDGGEGHDPGVRTPDPQIELLERAVPGLA